MEFQMKDVCRLTEITMPQGQYWTRLNIVEADITGATSQGRARLFSLKNLFEFALVHELTTKGIEVRQTSAIIKEIPRDFLKDLESKPQQRTLRLLVDPLMIHYGEGPESGFFFTTHLEISTKGESKRFWFGQSPPGGLIRDLQHVKGFEKVGVILQHFPSAIIVNLETMRRRLLERVNAEAASEG
jgi:hypothetical protein